MIGSVAGTLSDFAVTGAANTFRPFSRTHSGCEDAAELLQLAIKKPA